MARAKKPTKTPDPPADAAVVEPSAGTNWNKISAGIVGLAALSGAIVAIGNNSREIRGWFVTGDEAGKTRNEASAASPQTIRTTEITTTKQTTVTPSGETTTTERRTEVIREVTVASSGAPPPPLPPPPVNSVPPPPPPLPQLPPPPVYQEEQQQVPPRPVLCASGPFIVFFDWDRDGITPQAAAILDNAAAAYHVCGPTRVWVAGHADRSGPANYNVGLSQARADSARTYLADRGIADDRITTEAFGESRPLVETADGVREPQNRRVEVTFGPDSGW